MGLARAGSRRPSDCYSAYATFDRRWIGSPARRASWSRRLVRRRDRARRAGGVADRRRPRRRGSPAVVGRAAGRVSRLIEADLGTGRMEAFSDGVIAIIITIMVLAGGAVPTERLLTSLPRC